MINLVYKKKSEFHIDKFFNHYLETVKMIIPYFYNLAILENVKERTEEIQTPQGLESNLFP